MTQKRFPKNVAVLLTTDEYVGLGKEMGRTQNDLKGLQDRAKQVKADFTAKITEKEARLNSLSTTISNGYEYREVDCFYVYRANAGQKDVVRSDTGEIIGTEPMSKTDFQENLPLDDPADTGGSGAVVDAEFMIEDKTGTGGPGDPKVYHMGEENAVPQTQKGDGSVPEPGGDGG